MSRNVKPKHLKHLVIFGENRDYTFCRGKSCFMRSYIPDSPFWMMHNGGSITIHRDGPAFRLDDRHDRHWPSWAPKDRESLKVAIAAAKKWKDVHRVLDDAMEAR